MARSESEFPKPEMSKGKDKGFAPPFREASEVGDGENINVPADAQGRSVQIFSTGDNLRKKGEGNYVGPFREVIGPDGLLSGSSGIGFVNENRESDLANEEKGVK